MTTEKENEGCRCTVTDRRRAALIALSRAALELDELREARERAGEHAIAADELAEHIEARLFDEARSLGVYEDEYECGCGSTGEHAEPSPPADQAMCAALSVGFAVATVLTSREHSRPKVKVSTPSPGR